MKALRPVLREKKKQKELLATIKDPELRAQIVSLITKPEAPSDAGEKPAGEAAESAPSEPASK